MAEQSPGRAVGPSVLAPCPAGVQPRDAAFPRSHSSTSSSSSTSSGYSPPSCGRPMLAGVTRGSSTGEPCPPCPGSSELRGIKPQHHVQKQRWRPKNEPVSREKTQLLTPLAGPAQQRRALAWPLDALRAPQSQPGPLGARSCTRAGVCKGGTNPDLSSKSWSQGVRGTGGQRAALRRHSSAETWQGGIG